MEGIVYVNLEDDAEGSAVASTANGGPTNTPGGSQNAARVGAVPGSSDTGSGVPNAAEKLASTSEGLDGFSKKVQEMAHINFQLGQRIFGILEDCSSLRATQMTESHLKPPYDPNTHVVVSKEFVTQTERGTEELERTKRELENTQKALVQRNKELADTEEDLKKTKEKWKSTLLDLSKTTKELRETEEDFDNTEKELQNALKETELDLQKVMQGWADVQQVLVEKDRLIQRAKQDCEDNKKAFKEKDETLKQAMAAIRQLREAHERYLDTFGPEPDFSTLFLESHLAAKQAKAEAKAKRERVALTELKRKAQEAQAQGATTTLSFDRTITVDDSTIVAEWKELQTKIRRLAILYMNEVQDTTSLTDFEKDTLKRVSPRYEIIAATEGKVHYLFEGVVWKFLRDRILSQPTVVWGPNHSEAAKNIFDVLRNRRHVTNEEYDKWRAHTVDLIHKERGVNDPAKHSIVGELYDLLRCFITATEGVANVHGFVKDIVSQALDIACIFNRSPFTWEVARHIPGLRSFDASTMKEVENPRGGNEQTVNKGVVISPLLSIRENSTVIVVAKATFYGFIIQPGQKRKIDEVD
ncbi:hypothetical protein GGS20DRAFT_594329 [Poronia punctata]|nr:hypothetical protein GGS20DRAFT_594329 [Poronia punctata]